MDFLRKNQLNIMLVLIGICGILSFLVIITNNFSKGKKRAIFLVNFSATMLLFFDRYAYIFRGNTSILGWWMVRISNFAVFFFSIQILFAFNLYIINQLQTKNNDNQIPLSLKISNSLLIVAVIMLVFSQFTGLYYKFDENNCYYRSNGILISYIAPVTVLIFQIECIIKNFNKIPKQIRILMLLFAILPEFATLLQIFNYGISFTNITSAGMCIVLYIATIQEMNEAVEKAHRMEIDMLKKFKTELEQTVELRTKELKIANEKVEHLLLNILPSDIAKELSEDPEKTISRNYPNATVLFTDIENFTKLSSNMTAEETVSLLNNLTKLFDDRAKKEHIEKIKTIGDAYMAAAGLTEQNDNSGAEQMIHFACGLLKDVENFNRTSNVKIHIRIGINSGPLVAGVIGKLKFIYDVWGDTVNVASRMESTGQPMKIHVSNSVYEQTRDIFEYTESIKVEVKGKGIMTGYFIK